MKIDFANLQHQYQLYKPDIDERIQKVLNKSNYIMGEEVAELEAQLANFTASKHVVSCSNGTDALIIAMMTIDVLPGDEIITTPFSFIATAETIAFLHAKPVFVDIDPITYNINPSKIEAAITSRTKAIMPVSLYGQPADMDEINVIATKHNLKVIIDGAQSFGATYKNQAEVHHCDIYTTSFFPAKPLGCYGDGGAVLTNIEEYADKMHMLRVHGQNNRYRHKYVGIAGRLDTIQAAVLLAKLPHYKKEIAMRQNVAKAYKSGLSEKMVSNMLPLVRSDRTSVYAQFTLRVENRETMQSKLKDEGIPTAVHYPMPLHLQECFTYLGYKVGDLPEAEKASKKVLSLPMNAFLSADQVDFISRSLT